MLKTISFTTILIISLATSSCAGGSFEASELDSDTRYKQKGQYCGFDTAPCKPGLLCRYDKYENRSNCRQ